ncbi:protein of unknown function DUF1983 [Vibrio phage 1.188.A._10N.286.51.A6]|uniref:Tip attachment protein J central straight fiber domain-containing protein n=3 Tax=Mukerjeevirus mv51A6 TaxID=2734162 RepID=A0A2I7RIX6_9CAUD|nr:protein of unknown function DUF1983 [Vibrio phage 1.188.A._10N.286.51.A6]AUR93610.1 protein of unknown function DUF1983 [Vibrio phage 1.188.A._10N.286.51.A6]AUR93696.1 protein of unknown function DUF1983 [Vibrio phage 1.188.B._10N.286.51.A6]AUR93782.1 protein of unknown function DUF1983 [Vibrio phage 1.188.C._10N.286.51.A6]
MLRVVGTIVPPVEGGVLEHVTMLVQCIKSSVITLENSFSPVTCDDTGGYDFILREGIYRIYIKYSTNTPTISLGTCGVVEGMPAELDLNNLLTNYTPQVPDYIQDLDDKWEDTWQDFINDNNTQHANINNSVSAGDAKVVEDMSVYINEVTGQQGASLREEISAGDAGVYNESRAYTDSLGVQVALDITQVANDVSTVSQQLTAYKDENGNTFDEIDNRITTNENELSSTISAQVESETGAMQLRIEDLITTGNAEISQSISVIEDALGATQAAWQIVATVDDLTSAIGMTNNGVNSEIFMQANALKFVDPSDPTLATDPVFQIENQEVFMRSAFIKELGATTVTTDELTSTNYDSNTGFKLHASGLAEFQNINAKGHINATSGSFPAGLITGEVQADQINTNSFVLNGQSVVQKSVAAGANRTLTSSYVTCASTRINIKERTSATRVAVAFSFTLNAGQSNASNYIDIAIYVDGGTTKVFSIPSTYASSNTFVCGDSGSCTVSYYIFPTSIAVQYLFTTNTDACDVTVQIKVRDTTQSIAAHNIVLMVDSGNYV